LELALPTAFDGDVSMYLIPVIAVAAGRIFLNEPHVVEEGLAHRNRAAGSLPGECELQIAADLSGGADLLFRLTEPCFFFIFVKL
jgi:hypothetical protein